jgi:hypothetical protein
LSPARLRTLPPAVPAPSDLLLRTFEPPMIVIGGQDLGTLLRPAYLIMGSEGGTGETDAPSQPELPG